MTERLHFTFASVWDECNCVIVWTFFSILPFFGIGMETDLFQSCGHCCYPNLLASFRIWNSSTGVPSPPLALFVVMLPKAHLILHSRMSGSRWVITPSWLSGSWRYFLYRCSVYSCHIFLVSSASVSLYLFCPLLCPSLHEMFPWYHKLSWRDL